MQSFIESIEIYRERQKDGHYVKAINFNFPVSYNGELVTTISPLKETTVETIVCLSKLADTHIEMEVDPEELDTITAKVSPTYPEIKAYVLEHHGLKVSSLAIAQTKKKCGLEVGECYNLPSGHGRPPTNLTPEREAAIREAFQYYGLI